MQGAYWDTWCGKLMIFSLTCFSTLLGGFDAILIALIVIASYDVIIGTLFSLFTSDKDLAFNSNIGFMGVLKKILMLATVSIAKYLDTFLGVGVLRNMTVVYYIINNIMSVFELHILYNVPLPSFIVNSLSTWVMNLNMGGEFSGEEDEYSD